MDKQTPLPWMRRTTMPGKFGPIPAGIGSNKLAYVARDVLVGQVARTRQGQLHDPEYLLRHYWTQKDGGQFATNLKRLFSQSGALDIESLLQFDDTEGIRWWVFELAVDFTSKYDGELQVLIIHHFVGTAIQLDGQLIGKQSPLVQQGASMSLEQAVILNKQMGVALETLMDHDRQLQQLPKLEAGFDQHTQTLQRHELVLADLRARAAPAPGKMLMREFIATRLHIQVSDRQILLWGQELSKKLDEKKPGWRSEKIWDEHSRRPVNEYPISDLEDFFRDKGYPCSAHEGLIHAQH